MAGLGGVNGTVTGVSPSTEIPSSVGVRQARMRASRSSGSETLEVAVVVDPLAVMARTRRGTNVYGETPMTSRLIRSPRSDPGVTARSMKRLRDVVVSISPL